MNGSALLLWMVCILMPDDDHISLLRFRHCSTADTTGMEVISWLSIPRMSTIRCGCWSMTRVSPLPAIPPFAPPPSIRELYFLREACARHYILYVMKLALSDIFVSVDFYLVVLVLSLVCLDRLRQNGPNIPRMAA